MKSPTDRLVIGLDSSTQSAKAIAWDRTGHMVAEGRAPIPLSNPGLGRFEQDPEDWWTACRAALQACTKQIDAGAVDALAISNQRETVAFLDAEGRALHPALTWLDERTRAEVAEVSELIGPETVHRITGRYPDVILCLYRFLWIKKHRPDVWERTACFADVQAFLVPPPGRRRLAHRLDQRRPVRPFRRGGEALVAGHPGSARPRRDAARRAPSRRAPSSAA